MYAPLVNLAIVRGHHSDIPAKSSYLYLSLILGILHIYTLFTIITLTVAVVGLEKTFYRTTEGLGVVEVCAVVYSPSITCPIEFPFSILLQTADGSAGAFVYFNNNYTVLQYFV